MPCYSFAFSRDSFSANARISSDMFRPGQECKKTEGHVVIKVQGVDIAIRRLSLTNCRLCPSCLDGTALYPNPSTYECLC
jgi:hypothetical protein